MRYAKWIISLLLIASLLCLVAEASPKIMVRVMVEMANVRESPSIKSPIIMTVKMGTLLEVADKTGPWYKVVLPKTETQAFGFIHQSVVEEMAPVIPPEQVTPPAEKKERPVQKEIPPPTIKTEPTQAVAIKPSKEPYKKIFMRLQYQMGFQQESQSLNTTRTVYYENAQYGLNYTANKGNSIDAAIGFRFTRMIGVALGFSSTSRGMAEKTSVSIPHPLWMNYLRSGEAEASSLNINAIDLYLNLVCFLEIWKFGLDLYAGPCYMLTKANIITDISFSEGSYPYTQVTFTALTASAKSNVIGFNAGASLGLKLAGNFAIFVDGRYVMGKGSYKSGTDIGNLPISLGGLKAGVGIKIMF